MVLKRISPFSCAKISGVLYSLVGFIIGIFFSLIALAGMALGGDSSEAGLFGAIFGIAAVILAPIFYGLLGFIGGALMGWLYNVVASWIGGLEVEFEQDTHPAQSPSIP